MKFLEILNTELSSITNYQLGEWNGDLTFPFWVGEYQETDYQFEQGKHEYSFTLTGTSKGTYEELEKDKESIFEKFKHYAYLGDSTGVIVVYNSSILIPSEDEQIRRMQIILDIIEWRY